MMFSASQKMMCFALQNVSGGLCPQPFYNCRPQAQKYSGIAGIHHVFARRKHIMCDSTHHFAWQNILSGAARKIPLC